MVLKMDVFFTKMYDAGKYNYPNGIVYLVNAFETLYDVEITDDGSGGISVTKRPIDQFSYPVFASSLGYANDNLLPVDNEIRPVNIAVKYFIKAR